MLRVALVLLSLEGIATEGFSGPLNWLNAILSLLHSPDSRSAMGTAIVRLYLALSRIHTQALFNLLVLSGSSTIVVP